MRMEQIRCVLMDSPSLVGLIKQTSPKSPYLDVNRIRVNHRHQLWGWQATHPPKYVVFPLHYHWEITTISNLLFLLYGQDTPQWRKRRFLGLTRMWVIAKRDGRPAEYRWRPLFNAAKFGWRPLLKCRAVTMPRRETRWNLQGCLKLANRSQPLVGRSSPYCEDMWGRHCCLTFFPIVDMCLSCEDMPIARQSCAMVPRWQFFGDFWVLHFHWAARSVFQTCILNLH